MSSKRRTYSREFKIEAVKLSYSSDKMIEEVAQRLMVSTSSLHRWRGEYGETQNMPFQVKGNTKN